MSKPLTIAVFGGRGTGKTAFVKQEIARFGAPRMVIWDFKNDPSLEGVGAPFTSLPAMIRAMGADRFQLRYLVNHRADIAAQFELFCAACFEAGCLLMFVDELPEVTKANRAPPAWRRCVNVGRDYRDSAGRRKWLAIVGAGQRPAECDKSFIGNADIIHTGRLGHMDDAREMAKAIGCSAAELVIRAVLRHVQRRRNNHHRNRRTDPVRRLLIRGFPWMKCPPRISKTSNAPPACFWQPWAVRWA